MNLFRSSSVRAASRAASTWACLLAWVLSSGLPLRAGAAEGPTPTPAPTLRQILDRSIEASGGRAALEKLTSRESKGTIEVTAMGVRGPFVLRAKAPNRQASVLEFGGFGSIREGFDGTVAWSALPLQGITRKKGGELARVQRTTLFPRELKLEQAYDRMEVKGAAKAGGVDAWLVLGEVKGGGKPDRLYFDQKTGLLIQEESTVPTAVGEMTFRMEFGDYRVVDGVKVAHRVMVPEPPEMGFRVQFESIRHNLPLADEVFAEPKE